MYVNTCIYKYGTKLFSCTYRAFFYETFYIKPNSNFNYTFPIELEPNGIPFDFSN